MKMIRSLSVLIALAVFAAGCEGPAGPTGADVQSTPRPAASAPAVGSNTIPAASLDQAVEYEPYVSDSLTVSFEGTKIRILNTSGGTRLVEGKPWIWDIDWNVKAWNPDSTEVDLVAISNDPGWHPVKGHISSRLNLTIYCKPWGVGWEGPRIGYGSGFGSEYLMTIGQSGGGGTRKLDSCPVDDLNIRIQYSFRARETDRDTWTLQHNYFPFPSDIEFGPFMRMDITYHPIVSDSSYIESETTWLKFLVEDRRGFEEKIERMLPVSVNIPYVGEALVVPPDTTTTGYFEDAVFSRAVEKLRAEYPQNDGFSAILVGGDIDFFKIRTGIMSEKMQETYGFGRLASRGKGYVGQPWSVFLYEKKWPHRFQDEILVHEIGHNLGLIHTDEDPNYPGYASELNKDAYLVEAEYPHTVVFRLDALQTEPVMISRGFDRRDWLSEYNWNNILDFFDRGRSSVSARVVAGGDHMWICKGQH